MQASRINMPVMDGNNDNPAGESNGRSTARNIPGILRGIGVFAVLLSLYGFFMKGWDGGNDLLRYGMLLGHTMLLAVIGLGSGYLLKEGKGARLLLMLALVSVVAVFSILGSFIYAAYGPALNLNFINAMRWNLDSIATTIAVTTGSILVLLPLMAIAFRVLARGISTSMFSLFALGNLALLLPVRDPVWIALMAMALGCYTLLFSLKTARQRVEVKTREGLFVVLLQFAPMATLLIRNLWLHDAVHLLYATSFAMSFIALRQIGLLLDKSSLIRWMAEMASVILAIMTGLTLFSALENSFGYALSLVFASLVCTAMIFEISLRSCTGQQHYRTLATLSLVLPLLANLWGISHIVYLLAVLACGIGLVCLGYHQKQRSLLLGGVTLVIAGLVKLGINLWFDFDVNAWVVSAALGIVAIVLASLLESRGNQLKQKWQSYRLYFSEWSN